MRNSILLSCFLTAALQCGFSQTGPPSFQWISTGTVEAKIESAGPFLSEFRIPGSTANATVPGFQDILLWIGGIDPGGNLGLAIEQNAPSPSSFQGGFRGVPNSAGVWKVTKAEIEQHRLDFEQDGDIDDPIPAIFSWPGKGNPFSLGYNGFSVDSAGWIAAPFMEDINDQVYDPSVGDFPFYGFYTVNLRPPDEIVYMPFVTKPLPAPVPFHHIILNCNAVYLSYYCDDVDFLDEVIFGNLNIQLVEAERRDSFIVGFVLNGDVGNHADDYIGTQLYDQVYFCNGDGNDPVFGDYSPVVGFEILSGLIDTFGIETGIYSVMPLHSGSETIPAQMKPPISAGEYYNYLTGTWRDGSPLTPGGNGYNPGNPDLLVVTKAFPGNPANPDEWSEQSAGNPPGSRRAIATTGPITLKPGNFNRVVFAIEHIPAGQGITDQLASLTSYSSEHFGFFYHDFIFQNDPYDTLSCFLTSGAPEPHKQPIVHLTPNPTKNDFALTIEQEEIIKFSLFDMLGRTVKFNREHSPSGILIRTENLPSGMYCFSGLCRNGQPFQGKVILTR